MLPSRVILRKSCAKAGLVPRPERNGWQGGVSNGARLVRSGSERKTEELVFCAIEVGTNSGQSASLGARKKIKVLEVGRSHCRPLSPALIDTSLVRWSNQLDWVMECKCGLSGFTYSSCHRLFILQAIINLSSQQCTESSISAKLSIFVDERQI